MPRPSSRGCVLALLGMVGLAALACKPDASTGTLGSPSASAAGSEAKNASPHAETTSNPSNAGALARRLVAVTATRPNEAMPCERTCGRVGDCLLETRDVGEFEASRLELECLDLCVHSPESAESRSAFLACEQQSGCGELLGCARSNWDTLVANRVGPTVQGVTVGGDPCAEGCRWLYSCIYTSAPPGQVDLGPEQEELIRYCDTACESLTGSERAQFVYWAECMPAHCSQGTFEACMLPGSY
jgi:hypothetical protein